MPFGRIVAGLAALSLCAGVTALVTYDDPRVRLESGSGSGPSSSATRSVRPRTTSVPTTSETPPSTTTTMGTAPAPTSSDPAAPTPSPAPAPTTDVLTIDRPGAWAIRADGSDAIFLGEVGLGGPRGYGGQWGPDSALYGIQADANGRSHLVRTTVSGNENWYDLPPSPPITDEIGPAPRWITDFRIYDHGVALSWMRDDGFAGASIASFDLSRVLIEFDDDRYGHLPVPSTRGDRFAFGDGESITIVDAASTTVAGPYRVSHPNGAWATAWTADDSSLLVTSGVSFCLLDLRTGRCPWNDSTNLQDAQLSPVDTAVLTENLRIGSTSTLSVVRPGAADRVLTDYGGYPVWHPDGARIAFGRSPYRYQRSGSASVHVIGADGSGERLLANTANAVAFPWGWSPDGKWIAVHLGGPA